MSTLFTFGCSFSEEFSVLLPRTSPNTRVDYIEQYFNGVPPDSWPTMLSKKLGLSIKNYRTGSIFANQIAVEFYKNLE